MSYLDTVVTVNISATSASISLPGTNIPAIVAYHTHNTDLIRSYTELTDMASDGFSENEPAYLMAQSLVQQNPRPSSFRVIRGTTAATQVMTFTVTDNTDGNGVGITLTGPDGVEHDLHHTVSSETTTQVATAIALLDFTGMGITSSGAVVTLTATNAGEMFYVSDIVGGTFADTTADANQSTDLTNALLVDNTWYGVSGSLLSSANISDVAAWVASNKKAHFYTTADSANLTSGSGIMDTLRDAGYTRSIGLYSRTPRTYGATGWMSGGLVEDPGSYNFAYKTIAGTEVDTLTPTEQSNIIANNGNFYTNMAGANVTIDGRSAEGQFIDITIGIDGLTSDIQERVANLLVSNKKLPYTRKGMGMVKAEVSAALQAAVLSGFLTNESGFEFSVSVPQLEDVSAADKAARTLNNVNFVAYAQGAINKIRINGTVSI